VLKVELLGLAKSLYEKSNVVHSPVCVNSNTLAFVYYRRKKIFTFYMPSIACSSSLLLLPFGNIFFYYPAKTLKSVALNF